MFEHTKQFHRVPIAFGPAPSPRQDPAGKRFDWSQSQTTTIGIVVECDRKAVQAILPDGYTVEPPSSTPQDKANVLFEVMELRNLPWLAGRGYNTWGVYISDVVCHRAKKEDGSTYKASYLAVLFESFTDPITTGREELGFPKIWAELPDGLAVSKGDASGGGETRVHTASWFGYEFMRLEIRNLKEHDPATAPALTRPADGFTHPSQHGFLHHRYVPAVGEPGRADASYATFNPAPPAKAPVKRFWAPFPSPGRSRPGQGVAADVTGPEVELKISPGTFEQLPTLHNVVRGLSDLRPGRVLEAAVQEIQGASDLMTNHRIEK
ncbi:hypothetical protein DHEL01_v210646 [Diaporthe helianthi]|uniref:Acetoacetate decarboxylase n=1 Tax=Diaporthe helianthi TaxID=158607 RepID=A0A2P5HL19_DIAHE|nr:hypothetical protein DHEL01_v210646 [Diaporthe helianthi]